MLHRESHRCDATAEEDNDDQDQMTQRPRAASRRTLSDTLCVLPNEHQRQDLEVFRVHFESEHGATDLTKRYTSTWPTSVQQWMYEQQPQRWYDGLPPFVKVFLKDKVVHLVQEGKTQLTDERSMRSDWIQTGPGENDRIERFWLSQYLNGPLRAPDDAVLSR